MNMINLNEFGLIRVGSAVPKVIIGDPYENCKSIYNMIIDAKIKNIKVLTFPELSVTGYTCADLFNQRLLLDSAEKELEILVNKTQFIDMLITVGMPIMQDNQLFNCAVVIYKGEILGVIPKTYIPNYNEFYEKRWFASSNTRIGDRVYLLGKEIPFTTNIIFKDDNSKLNIAIEICEDLWVPNPPSINHCLVGANLILNLSASNEVVGKYEYRKNLIKQHSASCVSAYVYCSAGQTESTTDVVFSGHSLIAENGSILKEDRFNPNESLIYADIDIERLENDRRKFNSYMNNIDGLNYEIRHFKFLDYKVEEVRRNIDALPFVPSNDAKRSERCEEIFTIQSIGLAQRLSKTGIKKAVIGISGGLDSTLALLVMIKSFERLNLPMENIIGITMPGFGTTHRTLSNSSELMKEFGITTKEISIKDACIQHFKDIEQDPNTFDITYENSQARERTQILMDVANKENALVVGTGDLSELALGWCTYNGDHMSMYAVNVGVPKTLVKYLVSWYAEHSTTRGIEKKILDDIVNTPISPELLPPDKDGNIAQKTEDKIGPYELHDFFLYNMIRFGYSPKKIFEYTKIAFANYEKEEILKWMEMFYRRFFISQFKRSALPSGPKVGSISLSPRSDWRMPDDASYNLWIRDIENIKSNL